MTHSQANLKKKEEQRINLRLAVAYTYKECPKGNYLSQQKLSKLARVIQHIVRTRVKPPAYGCWRFLAPSLGLLGHSNDPRKYPI